MPRQRARRALIVCSDVSNNSNMKEIKKKKTTYIHGNKRAFLFQITEGYN